MAWGLSRKYTSNHWIWTKRGTDPLWTFVFYAGDLHSKKIAVYLSVNPMKRYCCMRGDSSSELENRSAESWRPEAFLVSWYGIILENNALRVDNYNGQCQRSLESVKTCSTTRCFVFSRALLLARSDSTSHSAMSYGGLSVHGRTPPPWLAELKELIKGNFFGNRTHTQILQNVDQNGC